MLNTDYETVYFTKKEESVVQWLNDIGYATDINTIKWEQKWDNMLQQWYYTACDTDFGEEYLLYYEPSTLGCVFQLTNTIDEKNFEIDDVHYSEELKDLREKVILQINSQSVGMNRYSTYSTKLAKQEKAKKQLAEVESMRNSERL